MVVNTRVRMTKDGFQSEQAAQFDGKRALAEFLDALLKEDIRALRSSRA